MIVRMAEEIESETWTLSFLNLPYAGDGKM